MLAALQQLISHGTKHCLASTDVGPAVVIIIPPDFIDHARKLKADVGAARGYSLGGYGYGYGSSKGYGYGYGYGLGWEIRSESRRILQLI